MSRPIEGLSLKANIKFGLLFSFFLIHTYIHLKNGNSKDTLRYSKFLERLFHFRLNAFPNEMDQ